MLELAREDPASPYTGGASIFYRFVARLRAECDAGAAPVIRFEGLRRGRPVLRHEPGPRIQPRRAATLPIIH
jgi:hypothetical protein